MRAVLLTIALLAQDEGQEPTGFPGTPANHTPVIEIPWNRLYDYPEVYAHFDRLVEAYPGLFSMQVIGRSIENREMRVYTLNNPATGAADSKPAMWVDGNIHGNEVQGGEAVVYLAWYLLENDSLLPLVTTWGQRTRTTRPAKVLLRIPEQAELLAGSRQQLVSNLAGAGGRRELEWLVRGVTASSIGISVETDHAGSARAIPEVK